MNLIVNTVLNNFKDYKIIILLLLFQTILGGNILRGSHIVGGEITYKFVERQDNKISYKFTMKIYRDIYLSNANANFDDPARIAIYLMTNNGGKLFGTNNSGRTISVPIKSRAVVKPPDVPCLTPPSNIAVEEAIYEWDAVLFDTTFSYVVSYQRCCRNNAVVNISNSGTTGATYSLEITPEAQHINNSSPTFKAFPPLFICGGELLKYDHSAADVEGDQLVYQFCSPLVGGTSNNPSPNPPAPPPYATVSFKQPNYTASKPMAGSPVVTIDPNSGIITGAPNVLGQYVISVCVEEYRNGKLLGKIFRDFQFVVAECQKNVAASITADSSSIINGGTALVKKEYFIYGCENVTLTLDNQSKDRSQINNFYWEFNNKGVIERYNEWSPTITFRDTGLYLGKLLLNPGLPCGDSAFVKVQLGGRIDSDFKVQYDTCVAGSVNFDGVAVSAYPIKEIIWNFGDGKKDSNRLKIAHDYDKPGVKTVSLSTKDKYGCKGDTSISFNWEPAPPILIVEPDNFVGCSPGKVFFNNKSKPIDTNYNIKWDFGDGKYSNEISPTHIYAVSDTYNVRLTIISPIGCRKDAYFNNWIKIKPSPKADFDWSPKLITNLNPSISFEDKSSSVVNWRWFFGNEGYSSKSNPVFNFRDTGSYNVKLYVRNTEGCVDSVFKSIYVTPQATFYLPTAFTPNFDTKNDEFKGVGSLLGVKSFQLSVWNRWGEKVFFTQNPQEGWNGQKDNIGRQEPDGVYMYEVIYISPTNEKISKRDFITLYR
jgi:gliding motility-associated-like protein